MTTRRQKLTRLLRIGAWLVASSIVLLEVVLRIASQFPGDSAVFISDPEVGFRMRPHRMVRGRVTNAAGFNDVDHGPARDGGVSRIAFIGDSFVFGAVPRHQNFTTVFHELANREEERFETLNMGIPAAGPENYLGLLENDAVDAGADIIGVMIFVGNDILQSHPDFRTRLWLGAPRALLRSPFLFKWSGDYFYGYKLLRAGTRIFRNRLNESRDDEDGTLSEDVFLDVERRRLEICSLDPSPHLAASYRGAVDLLARMKQASDRHGKDFFVILAPDRLQVDLELRSTLFSDGDLDPARYDFDRPQTILKESLDALGIMVLDLLPRFRRQASRSELYLARNTHWNARGNELAARALYELLVAGAQEGRAVSTATATASSSD